MEAINFNRKELADYILHSAKDSFIEKVKALMLKENEEIVAYTADGKPLTKEKYIARVKKISNEIENGAKTYTSGEVKNYVFNRERK